MREYVETDVEFNIYTREKIRPEIRDEFYLRNFKMSDNGYKIINDNHTVGGAFINTLDVIPQVLPGNFGFRLLEQYNSEFSRFFRLRRTVQITQTCLEFIFRYPAELQVPDKSDYPDGEEDEEGREEPFSIKVPDLSDLINEFEKDDDFLYRQRENER